MVERFTITAAEQDPWVDADANGQWVRYADYAALEAKLAERAGGVNEDALRALAQAYDREDAAQRGEPDPWNLDDPGDIGDSDTWVSERLGCARAAAEAFLSTRSRTGAVKVELSGNTGELIDKMAEAIRGDTTSDDTPWATLSEDRKIGWRGDAERALAVVKEYLTTRRPSPEGHHPDDIAVDRFAAAMKEKLARKREEGRGGWDDKEKCSGEYLSRLLREHVDKGDPVDVGNLAMMLHQRGERIAPEGQQPVGVVWFGYDENTGEFTGESCSVEPHDSHRFRAYAPVATRPTERTVTEAMVEAAAASLRPDLFAPLDADDLRSDDFAWTRREDAKANALHSARAALAAALSTTTAREAVRVKPLEWEHVSGTIFDAQAAVSGVYRVRQQDGDWTAALSGSVLGWFETEAAAKRFANEHHEARILAALHHGGGSPEAALSEEGSEMADAPERIRVAQDADGFWTCREAVSGSQEYVRADLYAALEAQLAGARVKALEWETFEGRSYVQANCVLGQYQVSYLREFETWQMHRPAVAGTEWKENFSRHATKDDAKAAAQADYERRILSALSVKEPANAD